MISFTWVLNNIASYRIDSLEKFQQSEQPNLEASYRIDSLEKFDRH